MLPSADMAGDAKRRVPIHYKEEGEGMQIEEKLEVFRNFTIEVARKESEQQIAEYEASCHQEVEMFRQQKLAEMEHKIRNEEQRIRRQMNSKLSREMLHQKRILDECKRTWREKLLTEVKALLEAYQRTESYWEYLAAKIKMSLEVAGEEEAVIYVNPSDADKKEELERRTKAALTVSKIDFGGGIRAVIRSRNILIDESFVTKLEQEETYL